MTKQEAIIAMQNGNKVTHKYFTSDEWMRETDGVYEFEDGCLCPMQEFWQLRTDDIWQEDCKLYS